MYNTYHIIHEDDDKWLETGNEYREYTYNTYSFTEFNSAMFHDIISVNNETKAMEFVKTSLKYITIPELFKHIYKLTNKQLKKHKANVRKYRKSAKLSSNQTGGQIEILGNDEQMVYQFLLVMDTIHDFQKEKYHFTTHLEEFVDRHKDYIPEGYTFEVIKNEEECIRKLSKDPILIFPKNKTVINPFYSIEINTYKPVDDNGNLRYPYEELVKQNITYVANRYIHNLNSYSVDIFGCGSETRKRIEYKQLYSLLGYISSEFGDTIHFQVDGIAHPFSRLMFSMSLIKGATQTLFTIDQECITFIKANQYNIDDNYAEKIWYTNCSDTNLFDAADSDEFRYFDARPSGDIYDSNLVPYQVKLNGIKRDIPPKAYGKIHLEGQHHRYTETIVTYKNKEMLNIPVTNDIGTIVSSAPGIVKYIKTGGLTYNNKKDLEFKQIVEEVVSTFDKDLLFGLKRAGDWGQVEHCKRYGKVFVTIDRYAALYAYFRKVSTILIRNDICIKDYLEGDDLKNYPDLAQYSFIILNRH